MRNLILFIGLSFSVISCKKEKMVHITATNVGTGERLAGLHYFVVELSSTANGEKAKTVAEGDLDANGESHFALKIKQTKHAIRVVEPDNYCYRENVSITRGSNEEFNADFKFAPCAYRQHTINNINCEGSNDKIEISISRFVDNNYESPWIIYGCGGYSPNQFNAVPMGKVYYKWIVTRSGVSNTFYDTIYQEEGSYINYTIEY